MNKFFSMTTTLFGWFWTVLRTCCSIVANLFLLLILLLVLSLLYQPEITVPENAALILAPEGNLVEKKTFINPVTKYLNGYAGFPLAEETLLQDVLDVIRAAAGDERIKILLLNLDDLHQGHLNQFRTIGLALDEFRKSGKKIIATGDYFSQGHYYLASFADEIYLNPMGSVNLRGFGVYRLYMKGLIDRLSLNFHIFRVGSFKSATEPLTRTSMSPEAREANLDWLNRVWNVFCTDIADNRNFPAGFLPGIVNEQAHYLRRAGGSSSRMALDNHLVDGLKTRAEIEEYLGTLVSRNEKGAPRQIRFNDYLQTISPSISDTVPNDNGVGVIVASGNIVHGENVPGQISSTSFSNLIRRAREEKGIKALVLRVDSGGGSAFASEEIRRELLLLKQSGKPLVVSMGAQAASGAYWISADADRILASPFTLTGSIGIFGVIPTLEKALPRIGLSPDGVGTTRMAAAGNPMLPMTPELGESIQLSVEEGYGRFINVVAGGRNMQPEQVEQVAQGRVWDGTKAMELGLVDKLGGLEEAVKEAAGIAGISDFEPVYLLHPAPEGTGFFGNSDWLSLDIPLSGRLLREDYTGISSLRSRITSFLLQGDPGNIYAHNLLPPAAFSF